MKLIIEQGALQKALARVLGVIASRNTIAILDNVAIDATAEGVWLTSSDLVLEARAKVDATVVETGSITATAALLGDLVRSAPPGAEITLTHGGSDPRLIVQFGRSRYQVPVMARDGFPTLKPLEGAALFQIQAVDLKAMIGRVAFAQSQDLKAQPYLCGVYLHRSPEGGKDAPLRMVATNGHRLALAEAPAVDMPAELGGVLLPSKAVAEFGRALEGRAGLVTLRMDRVAVVLEFEDATLRSKVLDGTPVDYQRVFSPTWSKEIDVDRQLLLNTVRRVALVSDNKERSITLSLDTDVLSLAAQGQDAAQGTEELEVGYSGEPFRIGFNAKYVLDALGQTEAEVVTLRMNDSAGPCKLEPSASDPEHGPVVSILLPQRV
ncbi:DNA polymerase III subunit beta [Brevundimonas sp.]|uniref:DNA polymerase III subunit beta n=1 Tax=Brevundimonas sp. TaxID=1871086 RepID=UPI002FCBAD5F